VKRASGRRTITVQCQDPRIGTGNFDLVIPAEHDQISGTNVFPIVGSPNRITLARLAEAKTEFAPIFEPLRKPRVAVLVGGASRTHGTLDTAEAEHLGRMLVQIAPNHGLMVSTSRRTGRQEAMILRRHLANPDAFVWNGGGDNPYLAMLAWADAFVVTADSVNMICEAAATGKPIHVFPLPGRRQKAQAFQQSLAEHGITRPFQGKIAQWSYTPLDETGRAVERIKALLDLGAAPSDMQG
jgi:mitochondrial fission protein ELM1